MSTNPSPARARPRTARGGADLEPTAAASAAGQRRRSRPAGRRRPARRRPAARRRPRAASRAGPARPAAGWWRAADSRVGVAGVHPAEQRLDQPVHHLRPEPLRDQRRRPTGRRSGRSAAASARGVPGRAPSSSSTPERGQVVEVERHAHQRAREPVQLAAAPDPGRRGGRVDHVEPQLRAPGRSPSGRRLSIASAPTSTRDPGDLAEPELAADLGRPLQHHDVVVVGEQVGRGEPGDAAADDDDPTRPALLTGISVGNRSRRARPSQPHEPHDRRHRDRAAPPGSRRLASALLLAAGLGLAGCGGAGSDDESAEPASSRGRGRRPPTATTRTRTLEQRTGQAFDAALGRPRPPSVDEEPGSAAAARDHPDRHADRAERRRRRAPGSTSRRSSTPTAGRSPTRRPRPAPTARCGSPGSSCGSRARTSTRR